VTLLGRVGEFANSDEHLGAPFKQPRCTAHKGDGVVKEDVKLRSRMRCPPAVAVGVERLKEILIGSNDPKCRPVFHVEKFPSDAVFDDDGGEFFTISPTRQGLLQAALLVPTDGVIEPAVSPHEIRIVSLR